MGACGGVLATSVHFINQKIIKKRSDGSVDKEDKKIEPLEYAKVFVVMTLLVGGTVFFMNKKNTLFKNKLLGGSPSNLSASAPASNTNTGIGNVAGQSVNPPGPAGQATAVNTGNIKLTNSAPIKNVNMKSGGQTISSSVNPGLELSDINDIIHTGTPNF